VEARFFAQFHKGPDENRFLAVFGHDHISSDHRVLLLTNQILLQLQQDLGLSLEGCKTLLRVCTHDPKEMVISFMREHIAHNANLEHIRILE
jgi:hypothetical protein